MQKMNNINIRIQDSIYNLPSTGDIGYVGVLTRDLDCRNCEYLPRQSRYPQESPQRGKHTREIYQESQILVNLNRREEQYVVSKPSPGPSQMKHKYYLQWV